MDIKFSIITVCYNEEKTIRATMESVLGQKWKDFEYVIIDGASTDATLEIIRQYARKDNRIQYISEKDKGIFNAMNKGIKYAHGDFLFFLNAGDILHGDDVLDKVAEVAINADIVIGDVAFKVENKLEVHSYAVGKELQENLEKGRCVSHQGIFASKMCLEDGFDEQFQTCADYDWLCRQVNAGRKIVKVNTVITDFDTHGITNQVHYQKQHWKENFTVLEKNFPESKFKYNEETKRLFEGAIKARFQYKFMNQWLLLKQRGVDFSIFFEQKGIYAIAVYGAHYMGQRLYDELKGSPVDVKYVIDRNPSIEDWEIPVVHPDDTLEKVDAVVITPIFDFLDIKADLAQKMDCCIISIEEMLFYDF